MKNKTFSDHVFMNRMINRVPVKGLVIRLLGRHVTVITSLHILWAVRPHSRHLYPCRSGPHNYLAMKYQQKDTNDDNLISSDNYQSVTVGTSTWSEGIRLLEIVSGLAVNFDNCTGWLLRLLLQCQFVARHAWWNCTTWWRRTLNEFEQLMFGLAENSVDHFVHSLL